MALLLPDMAHESHVVGLKSLLQFHGVDPRPSLFDVASPKFAVPPNGGGNARAPRPKRDSIDRRVVPSGTILNELVFAIPPSRCRRILSGPGADHPLFSHSLHAIRCELNLRGNAYVPIGINGVLKPQMNQNATASFRGVIC